VSTLGDGPLGVGFADYEMRPGDHLPAFSDTDLQRRSVVVPFAATGLRHRQRVAWLGSEQSALAFQEDLQQAGVNVLEHLMRGSLIMLCRVAELRREGMLDPLRVVAAGRKLIRASVREGWPLVRLVLDMGSLLQSGEDIKRWLSYEALARQDVPGTPTLVLVHHDRRHLPEDFTSRSVACHPVSVLSGELHPNPWWRPPRDFLSVVGRPD